jgi:threonine dehydrogenase-like Zn-dependent dehydrogenase
MTDYMRSIWLKDGVISYRDDVEIPPLLSGEALVKMQLAGICATDLELMRGYYPFEGIIGHEFLGEVVEAPDARDIEGQRVVGEINIACGKCAACEVGLSNHCKNRRVLGISNHDGVFAEYFSLPIENLHAVPEDVEDESAVLTEPLAAAMEILQQVHIRPEDRVLLIGAGRLGQIVARVVMRTGCNLRVLAKYDKQRKLLAENKIESVIWREITPASMDCVIEATGSPEGFDLARQAVRPRGVIILKSTYKENINLNISTIVVDEITMIGSRCGPFAPALRSLSNGDIHLTRLIEATYPLNRAVEAIEHAAHPGAMKILISNKL